MNEEELSTAAQPLETPGPRGGDCFGPRFGLDPILRSSGLLMDTSATPQCSGYRANETSPVLPLLLLLPALLLSFSRAARSSCR